MMNDDLFRYLRAADARLLRYLDADRQLSTAAVEHLYRYAVALLQGFILPDHVWEDWGDFFVLAGAFVLAHGSNRLRLHMRSSELLTARQDPAGLPTDADRALLFELVRELGNFVVYHQGNGNSEAQAS